MAHDVFISYSSLDKPVADAVCATLEARKVRCWVAPRDVLPGLPYGQAIIEAIEASSVFVLVFSASANDSHQVMREVERAVSKAIPIIPLRIEAVRPSKSLEFFISAPHWLDALTPPLAKHLQFLGETVQLLLSRMGKQSDLPRVEAAAPVVAAGPCVGEQGLPAIQAAASDAQSSKPSVSRPRPRYFGPAVVLLALLCAVIGAIVIALSRGSTDSGKRAESTGLKTTIPSEKAPSPPTSAPVGPPGNEKCDRSNVVWVTHDGTLPLADPRADAEPASRAPLRFMEMFVSAAVYPEKPKEPEKRGHGPYYHWLVETDQDGNVTQHFGWVDERALLVESRSIIDQNTKIHDRAMIVNTVNSLRMQGQTGGPLVEGLAYFAPDPKARCADPVRLFRPFFVYADSDPENESAGFVLLGRSTRFLEATPREQLERDMIGWVAKERVCRWNTREAIEWHRDSTLPDAKPRRTAPAHVYRTAEDAYKAIKGKAVDELFSEPPFENGVSMPFADDQMRFPLLRWDPGLADPDKYPQKWQEEKGTRKYTLQRIGVYGGYRSAKGTSRVSAISPKFEAILREHKVDLDILKEGDAQIFEYGFVWDRNKDGLPQTRIMLLLREDELEDVVKALRPLQAAANTGGEDRLIKEDLQRIIDAYADEKPRQDKARLSLENLILRPRGLRFQSPLLKAALRDVPNLRLSYQDLHTVVHKRQLLEDILKGEEWDDVVETVKFKNGEEAAVWKRVGDRPKRKTSRAIHTSGDVRFTWYWIDFEKEWP